MPARARIGIKNGSGWDYSDIVRIRQSAHRTLTVDLKSGTKLFLDAAAIQQLSRHDTVNIVRCDYAPAGQICGAQARYVKSETKDGKTKIEARCRKHTEPGYRPILTR